MARLIVLLLPSLVPPHRVPRVAAAPPLALQAGSISTFLNLVTSYLGAGAQRQPLAAAVVFILLTVFGAVACVVVGILALPYAFKESGILAGVVTTLVIAVLSNFCIRLLVQVQK